MSSDEHWRDIPGLEGYYQASDKGRIRSVDRVQTDRAGRTMFRRGRILSQTQRNTGPALNISVDGDTRSANVARLVGRAFLGAPPAHLAIPRILHIDGNQSNNHADNLRWASHSETILEARQFDSN